MSNDLRVTPDGWISIAVPNSWYSLEQIQQAVLKAANPGLSTIDTSGGSGTLQTVAMNRSPSVNSSPEAHLPLPSTVRNVTANAAAGCTCQKQEPTANKSTEHLPLPSTYRQRK
jgi:hypothetical protein